MNRRASRRECSRWRSIALVAILATTGAGCSAGSSTIDPPATTGTTALTTQPTTRPTSTTRPAMTILATTTTTPPGVATMSFSVPVGPDRVTYDVGEPASGPTSFAVLRDGSVIIADTMAVRDGEPRLLHFDATGAMLGTIPLRDAEAYSIIDVASDGERLAVLDIYVAIDRYRVLMLDASGTVVSTIEVPEGFHLENGLTGLAWDDEGVLLELEGGNSYGRIVGSGSPEPIRTLMLQGMPVTVTHGSGRATTFEIGSTSFDVVRDTPLGGATLIGIAPNGTVLLVLDEVSDTPTGIQVDRRVRRYSPIGEMLTEFVIDAGEQHVQMSRPLEMTAAGAVAYFVTLEDRVDIRILDV